jgi:AcrR family transcriptional regulator
MAQALGRIRPNHQPRSERTQTAILDAAENIIARKGFERASVNEISLHAGVTIGAFYGRFDSKEALLQGLLDRLSQETLSAFEIFWNELPRGSVSLRQALERSMSLMVELYRNKAPLLRALNQAATVNPTIRNRLRIFNTSVCARLYESLSIYAREVSHPQPALAMKLGHEAAVRLLRSSLLNDEIDYGDMRALGLEIDDALLARQAARIWEAYLRVPKAFA